MKKVFVGIIVICMVLLLVGCQKESNTGNVNNNNNNSNNSNVSSLLSSNDSKKDDVINKDEYEAKLEFDGDHYVLKVFTNYIEDEFSFAYDSKDFLLDSETVLFEGATLADDKDKKRCSLKLDNNSFYEFNFIKLGNKEMKLGKNLIVY